MSLLSDFWNMATEDRKGVVMILMEEKVRETKILWVSRF